MRIRSSRISLQLGEHTSGFIREFRLKIQGQGPLKRRFALLRLLEAVVGDSEIIEKFRIIVTRSSALLQELGSPWGISTPAGQYSQGLGNFRVFWKRFAGSDRQLIGFLVIAKVLRGEDGQLPDGR